MRVKLTECQIIKHTNPTVVNFPLKANRIIQTALTYYLLRLKILIRWKVFHNAHLTSKETSVLSRKPELNTEALLQNPTGSWQPATIDSVLQVVI